MRASALATLRQTVSSGMRVAVALSGGIDSVVLLDVVAQAAGALRLQVSAVHVHHGISRHADAWAAFCARVCRRRSVPLRIERIDIRPWQRTHGIEAAARIARYRAFARSDVDAVLLAHHLNDQAETVLLQLLRGAGVAGLAGMGVERRDWDDASLMPAEDARGPVPKIVRPLLTLTRTQLAAYAARRRLRWIEDDTNSDVRFTRNRLRQTLMPALLEIQPAAVANLARSARHLAGADRLLGEFARTDLPGLRTERGVSISRLLALGPDRALNALRLWLRAQAGLVLDTDQTDELWRQLTSRGLGRSMRLACQGWWIERYRDELMLRPRDVQHAESRQDARSVRTPAEPFVLIWQGERDWRVDALRGSLRFRRSAGGGLAARHVQPGCLELRVRQGGERMLLRPGSGHRTLKNLFQEHAIAPRERTHWPLLFIGAELVCVPGIGYAQGWRASAQEPGWRVTWHPADPPLAGIVRGAAKNREKAC